MALADQVCVSWDKICEDPNLQNLPYKIETNEYGQVVMSPSKYWHGSMQAKLVSTLALQMESGELSVETAIWTEKGVKVADVTWASDDFLIEHAADESELQRAPELCIEVKSGSNSEQELLEKRTLYFTQGAREVWICDRRGSICVYSSPTKRQSSSALFSKVTANSLFGGAHK